MRTALLSGPLVIAGVLVVAVLLLSPPAASVAADAVVLVTLDTTRADRLSPYGLMDAEMPNLDRFAREGVLFRQAMTVAPLTLPAHTSLMTGLFPPSHGVGDNADAPLPLDFTTLAERLQERGFATAAFVGSTVLNADRGLAQGFAAYGDVRRGDGPLAEQRSADRVLDDALGWLERVKEQPFFIWIHLYDAHLPYAPPEPFRSRARDPYVGELLFIDAQLGRLRDALERSGRLDRSVLVIAGDHGEGLGDHGEAAHGQLLYDSVLQVPLIVRAPGVSPRDVADVVRLVDVMPTILDLLGTRAAAADGTSLMPILRGGSLELEAFAETLYPTRWDRPALRALRGGRYKLIQGRTTELYDLERDPFEERDLSAERPRIADLMQTRLRQLTGFGRPDERLSVPAPEVRARLAALGYTTPGSR